MPKIRLLYLLDEWTYRWRAHRQGHADKFILRSFIELQTVSSYILVSVVAWFKIPAIPKSSCDLIFSHRAIRFSQSSWFFHNHPVENIGAGIVIGFACHASFNRSTSCLNVSDTFSVSCLA